MVFYAVTQLTGLAFTVALLAAVVSMISSMALKDPQPRKRFTTTAAVMRAVAAASVTLGALLASYLVVGDVVFVAIMTAATAARRFGQRATILGMVAFMTYFVALFLGATLSMVPWLIIGLTIGTAVSLAMSSALQVGPDRAVRRSPWKRGWASCSTSSEQDWQLLDGLACSLDHGLPDALRSADDLLDAAQTALDHETRPCGADHLVEAATTPDRICSEPPGWSRSGHIAGRRSLACCGSSGETRGVQRISLMALARQQLDAAGRAGGGHTADTVYGGREKVLRQTVIGMVGGSSLAEHENPGEATVQVLLGRVRLSSGELSWEARRGDIIFVPDGRNSLEALEDSAVLLTVAKLP